MGRETRIRVWRVIGERDCTIWERSVDISERAVDVKGVRLFPRNYEDQQQQEERERIWLESTLTGRRGRRELESSGARQLGGELGTEAGAQAQAEEAEEVQAVTTLVSFR